MRAEAGYVDGTQISRLSGDRPNVTGTSGARGVYLDRRTGKWRARLRFKGKLMDFGSFSSFEDAVKARGNVKAFCGETAFSESTYYAMQCGRTQPTLGLMGRILRHDQHFLRRTVIVSK